MQQYHNSQTLSIHYFHFLLYASSLVLWSFCHNFVVVFSKWVYQELDSYEVYRSIFLHLSTDLSTVIGIEYDNKIENISHERERQNITATQRAA